MISPVRSVSRAARTVALAVLAASACSDSTTRGPASIWVAVDLVTIEPVNFTYAVAVDGQIVKDAVVGRMRFIVPGVSPGRHVVSLTGLPPVCVGGEPQEVTARSGAESTVPLSVNCSRASADLQLHVTTNGLAYDADGYDVLMDGSRIASKVLDGDRTLRFQPIGPHSISLGSVPDGCVAGPASSVNLSAGAVVDVSLTATCAPSGLVNVVTTLSGADVDPDGVVVTFDGNTSLRANGTATRRLSLGTHSFTVSDIAPNCSVAGALQGTRTVASNAATTVTVTGTCAPIAGGKVALNLGDLAGDTLANPAGDGFTFDLTSVTTRQSPGWLIFVLRFAPRSPTLQGKLPRFWIDLDTDENPATGWAPMVNLFGGSASQGVDYSVVSSADGLSAGIVRAGYVSDSLEHVAVVASRDSVIVSVPLNKLGGDDGNATVTFVVGGRIRPSDVVPSKGVVVLRRLP